MVFHWVTKCRFDRFATTAVTTTDAGAMRIATSASSGEIHTIITTRPSRVSTDSTSWLIDCCRPCEMLSMSLVTRLSRSPREWESK